MFFLVLALVLFFGALICLVIKRNIISILMTFDLVFLSFIIFFLIASKAMKLEDGYVGPYFVLFVSTLVSIFSIGLLLYSYKYKKNTLIIDYDLTLD